MTIPIKRRIEVMKHEIDLIERQFRKQVSELSHERAVELNNRLHNLYDEVNRLEEELDD